MEQIFLKILNMSITASYLVLAIVLLRILLKKAPKWLRCSLWVLVGIRLMLPFSFESVLSLIPSAHTVPEDILYAQVPAIQSGIPAVNSSLNPIIFESMAPTLGNSVNPMQVVAHIASLVWIVGMGIMLLYAAISYRRVRSRVQNTKFLRENIVICPQVDTPFILGIFRPTIFLPEGLAEMDTEYVIAHEKAHLRRKDHWWKHLGFLLLTIHWFNPVLWIAYILLCRDIELACDEKVIRELGVENKKPYAEALINCSAPRKLISACPLAFGESGIKGRIQSVLHYKKPTLWILIAALILSVATAVCFMLNPPEERLIRQKQTMYLTVTTSLPGFSAIEEDHFYAYDTAGILYKVGKTAPKDREHYDYSEKLTEGDRIVVFAEKPIRIRDHSGYPESRTPSYAVQATCIQLHQSLRVDDDTTDGRWFRATVVSQTEDYLLVKPHPRTQEAAQAELINVSLSNVAYPTNWKTGDPVSIYYSGPIDRGNPATISGAYLIAYNCYSISGRDNIATAAYDVDSDGDNEIIGIGHGPTSGVFTFVVTVWDDDGVEYANIFNYKHGKLSFTEENGKLQIRHQDYQGDNQVRYLDIKIVGIDIVLFENGKPIDWWGH